MRVVLMSFDPGRRAALVALLAQVSGKPDAEIDPYLDRLPCQLVAALPQPQAQELARRLERAAGAVVRLEASPAGTGSADGGRADPPPAPLGFGTRLRWALGIAFGTKATQVGLWSLALVVEIAVLLPLAFLATDGRPGRLAVPPDPSALASLTATPAFLVALMVHTVVSILLWGWVQTGMLRLGPAYFRHGGRPPFWRFVRDAFVRTPDLVSTAALVFLPATALPLFGLVGARLVPPDSALPAVVAGLGTVAGVGVGLAAFMTLPVAANETLGPWQAVQRGWRLAAGMRWAFIGHVLVLSLLLVLALAGGMALLGLGAAGLAKLGPLLAVVWMPLGYGILMLVLGFLTTAFAVLAALFYLEARVRKERACLDAALLPAPDWPRCDAGGETAPSRGLRAWMGFLLLNGIALGLSWIGWRAVTPSLEALSQRSTPSVAGGPSAPVPGRIPASGRIVFGDGRLTLVQDTFFADAEDPKVWIRLQARGLFPGDHPRGIPMHAVAVRVLEVRARDGRNLYRADHTFEKPYFWQVNWLRGRDGYRALRTVHLVPGSTADDIALVKGELRLLGRDVGEPTLPFVLQTGTPYRLRFADGHVRPEANPEGEAAAGDLPRAAYAEYQAGRHRQAIRLLDRVLAVDPGNAWAWYTRAWAYWQLGEQGRARMDMAVACELHYEDACWLKDH